MIALVSSRWETDGNFANFKAPYSKLASNGKISNSRTGNKTKTKHTESFPCSVTVSVFIILSLVSNRVFGVKIVFNDISAFRTFNFSFDSFLFIFNPSGI